MMIVIHSRYREVTEDAVPAQHDQIQDMHKLWFRAFTAQSQAFYCFVTAGGGAIRRGVPISERSIGLA